MKKKIRGNFSNEFRKGYKQSIYLQFITSEKNSKISFILKEMLLDKGFCVYTQHDIPFLLYLLHSNISDSELLATFLARIAWASASSSREWGHHRHHLCVWQHSVQGKSNLTQTWSCTTLAHCICFQYIFWQTFLWSDNKNINDIVLYQVLTEVLIPATMQEMPET